MSKSAPSASASQKAQRRLWLTISEVVGVLALVLAGLNYWDSHRERAAADRQASTEAVVRSVLVLTGTANAAGTQVMLQPLNPAQAIQSQRYVFPHAVLDHPMEVTAARPQVDLDWIAGGLKRALNAAHAPANGETTVPVGIITSYVQDGETHTDQSIYRLGYAYRLRFLVGRKLILEGVSLVRHGVKGDLRAVVDARWAGAKPAG